MSRFLLRICAKLLFVLVSASLLPADDAPSREQLARWADELSSDQFQARQLATQGLLSAGPPAAEFLIAAVRTGDAEVRTRAIRVLSEQAMSLQDERRGPARQALLALADAPEPLAARSAQVALDDLREMTIALAVGELTRRARP